LNYTRAGEHEDTGPRLGTGSSSRHRTGDRRCEHRALRIDEGRRAHLPFTAPGVSAGRQAEGGHRRHQSVAVPYGRCRLRTRAREGSVRLAAGAASGGRSRQVRCRASSASSWLTADVAAASGLGCRPARV